MFRFGPKPSIPSPLRLSQSGNILKRDFSREPPSFQFSFITVLCLCSVKSNFARVWQLFLDDSVNDSVLLDECCDLTKLVCMRKVLVQLTSLKSLACRIFTPSNARFRESKLVEVMFSAVDI